MPSGSTHGVAKGRECKRASVYRFFPALGTNGDYAIAVFNDNLGNLFYSVAWVP